MNIVDTLKKDHKEALALCKQIKDTSSNAEKNRKTLFDKLFSALSAHSKAEEKIVYESLKKADGEMKSKLNESIEEHHLADVLLEELSELSVEDDQWIAKLCVLKESLDHHIEEEEGVVLPRLEKIMSAEELDDMNQSFETLKSSIQAKKGAKKLTPSDLAGISVRNKDKKIESEKHL